MQQTNTTNEPGAVIPVGVLGASGYIGGEILRYLVGHPRVDVRWISANARVGNHVSGVLPNLRDFLDLTFIDLDSASARISETQAVFVCLPHNSSQDVIPRLAREHQGVVFIDLGGDFRSEDAAAYEKFYGREHVAPDQLAEFVYGFTEYRREQLAGARLIANPGCFATAVNLALAPLAAAGQLRGDVFVAALTGSSGAGNKPLQTTHHPERASNVRAYKPLVHQHLLEVEGLLKTLTDTDFKIHFVPQSGPLVRGIFATTFVPGLGRDAVESLFRAAYDDAPLVSVVSGSPELRWVQGGPRAVIGIAGETDRSVVFSAIDNLGKGAAGQAVQNFNYAFGLPETTGLRLPAGYV